MRQSLMNRCKSGCVGDMEPWRGNHFPMHAGKNGRQARLFEQEERDKRRKNTCPRPLEWTKSPQREYVKDRCIPMGERGKEGGKESRKKQGKTTRVKGQQYILFTERGLE